MSIKHADMNANNATDGLAAIGLLVLLLPAMLFVAGMTGSTFFAWCAGAFMLISAIRLMCGTMGEP